MRDIFKRYLPMTEVEEWRPVPGYEGVYEASSLGRIRSLKRLVEFPDGRKSYWIAGRILKQQMGTHEHLQVDLSVEGVRRRYDVHYLVCCAFYGPRVAPNECCHNDGIPTNNESSNLRWGTRESNMQDRLTHGVSNRGSRNGMSKLTELQATRIKKSASGRAQLASEYGVSTACIVDIQTGKRWAHV